MHRLQLGHCALQLKCSGNRLDFQVGLHASFTSLPDMLILAGLLLEGRPASAPFSLLASKASLGHSEPASGAMGLVRLYQVQGGGGCARLLVPRPCF